MRWAWHMVTYARCPVTPVDGMISGYDYDYDYDYDYGDTFTNLSFSQMENGGHYSNSTNGARQLPHKARY